MSKQHRPRKWKSRTLSLFLSVLMTMQLGVSAYAQADQPLPDHTAVTEVASQTQNETQPSEKPEPPETGAPTEAPQPETQAQPDAPDEAENQNKANTLSANSPVIPGYTQVKSADLDETKSYIIVSRDSDGNLFAFYPNADKKNTDPGNAIDPNHKRGCPAGTFVAELQVDTAKATVSAKWVADQKTVLDMNDLRFTLEKNEFKWGFVSKDRLYLSLMTDMLTEQPAYLSVSSNNDTFTIESSSRKLDFNKSGDKNQFRTGFATNFWGPGEIRFPIYLYTKDNDTVTPTVNKAALTSAIQNAEKFVTDDYSQESVSALKAALQAATAEKDNTESTSDSVKKAADALVHAMQAMKPKAELLAPNRPNSDHGTTVGEPFPNGVGGSQTVRIPALITLKNGWLAAAIDARWDACPDGFGIDTLFSVSKDNGKTWEYSFPNYFNDSVDKYWGGGRNKGNATAFLDPVMVQGKDGTIYLMTDLYSGGTFIITAAQNSGYEVIDGKERMAIHTTRDGKAGTYDYYVGDFEKVNGEAKAFAPVIAKGSNTAAYYVDEYYNLYTAEKQPMYCKQLGTNEKPWSGKYVQQNVFYYNADIHVRRATFLWMVTSKDNGKTWSAPTIMNPMVRKRPATHRFYGVGPGAGLCLDDGTVMLPCYLHTPEHSSFIYKNPGEDTWHRSQDATTDTSSESTLVQIDKNTVRQFCRDQHNVLRYTDHKRDPQTKTWKAQQPVRIENVPKTTMNQLSAIRYSKEINGKPVILVSTAATGSSGRFNGKIYAFNLENDAGRTMTLIGTYEVNKPGEIYGYSSLTELHDGSIGLLYEDSWVNSHASYRNVLLNDIVPSAILDNKRTVSVSLYRSVEDAFPFETLPTKQELAQMDSTIATAKIENGKVVYTGNQVGQTSYVTNGVTVTIHVKESTRVQEIPLRFDDSKKISVDKDQILRNTNPGVVGAEITTIDKSITVTGGQGHIGTDAQYNGALEPLAKALHVFAVDGNGFQVWSRDEHGQKLWLDSSANLGSPISAQPKVTSFEQQKDGTFFIKTNGRYLAFWRDGKKNVFDAGSSTGGTMQPLCKFKLYRPAAEGDKPSAELPGYVQVTQLTEVKDGGYYLIAAECKGEHYILRPSADGSKYAHVMKVDRNAQNVQHTVENKYHTLTLTGKSCGTGDVVVGDVIYRVTVSHDHTFDPAWKQDHANHWHECTCGEKTDVAAHTYGEWTETKAPTHTETGSKVRQCTVCGHEEIAEIPVIPTEPDTTPTEPETKPTAPTEPEAKPTTPSEPSTAPTVTPEKPANPQTGDSSQIVLWISLIMMSGFCILAAVLYRKKSNYAD